MKFNFNNFKSNFNQAKKTAFKDLKSTDNIIKADKERHPFILDKNHDGVNKLLNCPYIALSHDPSSQE